MGRTPSSAVSTEEPRSQAAELWGSNTACPQETAGGESATRTRGSRRSAESLAVCGDRGPAGRATSGSLGRQREWTRPPCGWSQPWPCHPSASVTRCEVDLAPP